MSFKLLSSLALLSLVVACGSSSDNTTDAGTADAGTQDAGATDAGTDAGWPPSTPWWTENSCNLPACSASGDAPPFNSTGNWTVTLTTTSTDCNENVQALDDRLKKDNVHTGSAHPLDIAGTCDYTTQNSTRIQDGTFQGSTLITCEVKARPEGVIEVDESVVTFTNSGTGSGEAKAFFSNFPPALGQTDNKCQATFDVTLQKQP